MSKELVIIIYITLGILCSVYRRIKEGPLPLTNYLAMLFAWPIFIWISLIEWMEDKYL